MAKLIILFFFTLLINLNSISVINATILVPPRIPESELPQLLKALESTNPELQREAACRLGTVGIFRQSISKTMVLFELLIPITQAKDTEAKVCGFNALYRVLTDSFAYGDNYKKRDFNESDELVQFVKNSIVPILTRGLVDNSDSIRDRSAWALSEIAPLAEEAVPNLIKAIDDPALVNSQMFRVLINIGPSAKDAIASLKRSTLNPAIDTEHAPSALVAIAGHNEDIVSVLIEALKNGNRYAMGALEELGSDAKPAVPYLLTIIKENPNSYNFMRLDAIKTIVIIAPKDERVHAVLKQALTSKDMTVRTWVEDALERIKSNKN